MKGKNKLVPRLLGVTKDSVLRLDERTKEILKTWPLTTVRRWGASPNTFTLDFGDYSDQYYSVQTTEAEQILQLISGYIDIILKKVSISLMLFHVKCIYFMVLFFYYFRKSLKIILELKETKVPPWWKIVFPHLSKFLKRNQFLLKSFYYFIIWDLQEFDFNFIRVFIQFVFEIGNLFFDVPMLRILCVTDE